MWLINARTLRLESFEGDRIPRYAILSHRWEEEEVSFKDMQKQRFQSQYMHPKGYEKIKACCQQALADKLDYVWVDTCCIDKRSSAELSEAINSMFRWYQRSQVCYAFLSDIKSEPFINSQWFTRGWTLQELLAPNELNFYDSTWRFIGSRLALVSAISRRTGIEMRALESFNPTDYCVAQKMKWAADRQTTRIEDRAYSLLGLFQIHMPLLYGEAENAFPRLQREIMGMLNDTSIFMASTRLSQDFGMLGACPESYSKSNLQELDSYQCRFASTKVGIVGTFGLHRVALDIYALDLHRAGALRRNVFHHMLPFVRWNFEARQFQRVVVDGKYHTTTKHSSKASDSVGRREIHIGTLPLEWISSTSVSLLQTQSYMQSTHVVNEEFFVTFGVFSVDAEPVMEQAPSLKLEFADPIDEQRHLTRQCLCLGKCEYTASGLQSLPLMAVHFGKNRDGELTAFIASIGAGTKFGKEPYRRHDCHPDGYFWHTGMGRVFPPDKYHTSRWITMLIDDITKADHKIVEIGQVLRIHFVRPPQNSRTPHAARDWRVYIEPPANVPRNQIPEGWLLPDNRYVKVY